jgi:8-oxo-dGTP diphosphatase
MGSSQSIRTAARAIIISEGKLLVAKMRDHRGIYYILPGGGQQHGETLEEAVVRECREEVGVQVSVLGLVYVREYIGRNHNFSKRHRHFHQLEHVFHCRIDDPAAPCPGSETDNHQVGVSWLALENFQSIRFYPEAIKKYFTGSGFDFPDKYLGDCN